MEQNLDFSFSKNHNYSFGNLYTWFCFFLQRSVIRYIAGLVKTGLGLVRLTLVGRSWTLTKWSLNAWHRYIDLITRLFVWWRHIMTHNDDVIDKWIQHWDCLTDCFRRRSSEAEEFEDWKSNAHHWWFITDNESYSIRSRNIYYVIASIRSRNIT